MHFICRSFLGHTETSSWSQYWENEPEDRQLASQKGHLFALANLVSDQDVPGSEIGHQIIDDINQRYFAAGVSPIPNTLKSTLESIIANPEYDLVDISLTLAVVDSNSNLYIAMLNTGYGFIVRNHQISKIITGQTGQVVLVSGKLQHDDLLFICTRNFLENSTIDNLKKYLSQPTIQEIEENILADLYTFSNQPTLASLLVGIYQDDPILTPGPAVSETISPASPPASNPSIYVTHLDSTQIRRRRQLNIIFAIVILAILGLSIYFGNQKNLQTRLETEYQTIKSEYQSTINSAKAIKNVNLEEAQKFATQAKDLAQKLQNLKIHSDESAQFISEADSILSTTGSADSYQPKDFYSTTLVNKDATYSRILLSKSTLYLIDTNTGSIDKLDIANKSQQKVLRDDRLKNVVSVSENNGLLYLLTNQEIFSLEGSSLSSVISLQDDIKDFITGEIKMWNGSLYLLAKKSDSTATIWKFNPSGTKFSSAINWIKEGNSLPSDISSMAINGQVWTISQTGQILPYNRGVKESFDTQVVANLQSASRLITSPDSEIIAFIEKDKQVYVYHKDGSAASNYNYGQLSIADIALDITSNRILVLCTNKTIYQINL